MAYCHSALAATVVWNDNLFRLVTMNDGVRPRREGSDLTAFRDQGYTIISTRDVLADVFFPVKLTRHGDGIPV